MSPSKHNCREKWGVRNQQWGKKAEQRSITVNQAASAGVDVSVRDSEVERVTSVYGSALFGHITRFDSEGNQEVEEVAQRLLTA